MFSYSGAGRYDLSPCCVMGVKTSGFVLYCMAVNRRSFMDEHTDIWDKEM